MNPARRLITRDGKLGPTPPDKMGDTYHFIDVFLSPEMLARTLTRAGAKRTSGAERLTEREIGCL